MFTAYVTVTIITALCNLAAAAVDFARSKWVLGNMSKYGLPHSWIYPLGAVKTAGALGLLAGIAVPWIGIAAAAGLFLYFIGAVATVARARCRSDVPYPAAFLLLATASLALGLTAA
ncbi:DoxX family protein [Saccharopolyspora erythraea]|uniref:DoxX family protein n=1 Tax=Saccharopolyspora erythraea TaxID=1836 RepID=UPI001BAA4567|nr:DoxX family protein [Saccharopolyspora erythraea]QUH00165.1 DoxX family protein [Saccharopolyspora erythraea]